MKENGKKIKIFIKIIKILKYLKIENEYLTKYNNYMIFMSFFFINKFLFVSIFLF